MGVRETNSYANMLKKNNVRFSKWDSKPLFDRMEFVVGDDIFNEKTTYLFKLLLGSTNETYASGSQEKKTSHLHLNY